MTPEAELYVANRAREVPENEALFTTPPNMGAYE